MKTRTASAFLLTAILVLIMSCGGGGSDSDQPNQPISACTYVYSDWSLCRPDGTQTRTVVSATPEGCVGAPGSLVQQCEYAPPLEVEDDELPNTGAKDAFPGSPSNPQYFITDNSMYAGKIVTTGTYTIKRLSLQVFMENDNRDVEQQLRVGIYSNAPYSGQTFTLVTDQPGEQIGPWSNRIGTSAIPVGLANAATITFTGLNTPVTPGEYWIVISADPYRLLSNHAVAVATNDMNPPWGECYSGDNGQTWVMFMYAKLKYAAYDN